MADIIIEQQTLEWFKRGVRELGGYDDAHTADINASIGIDITVGVDDHNLSDKFGPPHPPSLLHAIHCFSRGLFLSPRSPLLFLHRGEAFFRLCDFPSALVNFKRAHKLAPLDERIAARLAQVYYVQGRLALERGCGDGESYGITISSPSSSSPHHDIDLAIAHFTSALALQPGNSDFWTFRIQCWVRSKRYGKALAELNRFIPPPATVDAGQNRSAGSGEEEVVIREEDDPPEVLVRDEDEFDGDDVSPRAAAPPSHAAALPALPPALTPARTLQSLILRAKLYLILDRCDLSLRDALRAAGMVPLRQANREVQSILRGLARKAEEIYGKAIAHLLSAGGGGGGSVARLRSTALSSGPSSASSASSGSASADGVALAILDLSRALELNPNEVKYYALRGRLHREQGCFDASLRDLKQAIGITMSKRLALAQKSAAGASGEEEVGEGSNEADIYIHSFVDDPPSASTFITDSFIPPSASASASASTSQEPKSAEETELERSLALTYNALGVSYFRASEFAHGVSCFSRAISLDPTNASFYANRADCHLALARQSEAVSDLHVGLRLAESGAGGRGGAGTGADNGSAVLIRTTIGSIHAARGRTLYNREDYLAACDEFTRAIDIMTLTLPATVSARAIAAHHLARSHAFYASHQYENAYSDCLHARQLDPSDAKAREWCDVLQQSLLRPDDVRRAKSSSSSASSASSTMLSSSLPSSAAARSSSAVRAPSAVDATLIHSMNRSVITNAQLRDAHMMPPRRRRKSVDATSSSLSSDPARHNRGASNIDTGKGQGLMYANLNSTSSSSAGSPTAVKKGRQRNGDAMLAFMFGGGQ